MVLIDARNGYYVEDMKPQRVCQRLDCPQSSYDGLKMRMCARCRFVRYCSKDCQRADWALHKVTCRSPPAADIGSWLTKYEFLFRWAALQAMGSSPNEHKTSTHCIFFHVARTERMTGPFPSPFIISDANCITHDAASELVYGNKAFSLGDLKRSLEICIEGGVGRAVAVFLVQGIGTPITWHFERYDLLEQLPRGAYCPGWPAIVAGVTNGYISLQDLSRAIASAPQKTELARVREEVVEGLRDIMRDWKLDEE